MANNEDADALFDLLKGRYGDRLTPEQLEDLRETVGEITKRADEMRSVSLKISDEPFLVFTPFRGEN
jgi:hypothetical protein